jgi:hypothetical protein
MDIERYAALRKEIEEIFAASKPLEGAEQHVSPSSQYALEITIYPTGEGRWNYSRGAVRRVSDQVVVADVKRNYGQFWHTWVTHASGLEYLLCGEDYQGYTVIELSTGRIQVHLPDEAFKGMGFCWTAVHPSPDGLTLAVDGCYWACPYELVFYDFSQPMQSVLPELERIEDLADTVGWQGNTRFEYVRYDESEQKRQAEWVRDSSTLS